MLVFPQRFQVQPADWHATVNTNGLKSAAFDLMQPNKFIQAFCRKESILCIDPTRTMWELHLKNEQDFYLPGGDMHWNRLGNRAFFVGARPELEAVLRDFVESDFYKP